MFLMKRLSALRSVFTLTLILWSVTTVQAMVLEGTGHAVIQNGDLDTARAQARAAALRDVALQYEAQVHSRDTMNNGVVTESELTVSSSARAREVTVLDERRSGNLLRITLRADMSEGASCGAGTAAGLKKRVAVTGFPMMDPQQAMLGRLDDAGEVLPQHLQARLQQGGKLQVLNASQVQLFHDVANAPTSQRFDNRLTNVVDLARELEAQFVVAGVIRSMAVEDPDAWGSSLLDRFQRGIGASSRERRFVVDLMVFDGFSGSPVYQERFSTSGTWDQGPEVAYGFDSSVFMATEYGRQVEQLLAGMAEAASAAIRCQPFITRISRVDGRKVTLAAGATAGLRPGDELNLYRSYSYFDSPGATPELQDSQATVTLDSVHPDFSNGTMPMTGGLVNIQRGDMAIVW